MQQEQGFFKNFIITRRQFLLGVFKLGLFGLVTSRLGFLQLVHHEKYSLLSNKNSISTIVIAPLRGEILDRYGNKLALNQQRFRLILNRPLSKKSKLTLAKMFQILALKDQEQEQIHQRIQNKPAKTILLENLSWRQIVLIEQNIFDLENLYIDHYFTRLYPCSNFLSHPIGYVAAASKLENFDLGVKQVEGFICGKTGIEKYYNSKLLGSFGFKNLEVDAHGNQLRELEFKPSVSGENLRLNIDHNLQHQICHMFDDLSGSAIVYDLKSQEVLALASLPNFHSASFTEGLSQKYWKELNSNIKLPLLNKAVQATYPPGSVFKLITCLAALSSGFDPNTRLVCRGGSFLGNHFHCWNKSGHGPLNMEEAIGCSCNYYMYYIAKTIGHKAIIKMAQELGLSQKVGIDLPDEASGVLSATKSWNLASSLNLSIGQGPVTITPLQLNKLVSIIATKGLLPKYSIVKQQEMSQSFVNVKPQYFDVIQSGMWRSVNDVSGTSRSAQSRVILGGKTGTAQVQSKRHSAMDFSSAGTPWHQKNHALFVCFAPFDDPRYAISVVIDHGGGGGKTAAPIAKKIVELLL